MSCTGHCPRNLQVCLPCYHGSHPGDKCLCHFTVGGTCPEAVASNLKDTKWQHQDLSTNHLTPPEPLLPATLLLCVYRTNTVHLDVCVPKITQSDEEQTRRSQVIVPPQSLLPGGVLAEHTCASASHGGLWQICALGPSPRISDFWQQVPGQWRCCSWSLPPREHSGTLNRTPHSQLAALLHNAGFRTCKPPACAHRPLEELEQVTFLIYKGDWTQNTSMLIFHDLNEVESRTW